MRGVRAHVDRKYVENLSNWFLMRYYKTVAVAAIETLRNMECLHGKPVSSSKTENGLFFYCGQKPRL